MFAKGIFGFSLWEPLILIGLVTFLAACGDDDSDFVSRPDGKGSSSNAAVVSDSIGNLTDFRDGQAYRTVTIGTQTWMAENLNYKTANSFCYEDKASNCEKYGRLYLWDAALKACPEGWHLPTKAEFETLFTAVGDSSVAGKMLKSTSGWTAQIGFTNEDAFGFSALPAGYRYFNGEYFIEGSGTLFWNSTEDYGSFAYYVGIDFNDDSALLLAGDKDNGFSVRCLKD